MRQFGYITVGKILESLRNDGLNITRATFRTLEKEGLWQSKRTRRNWRVYTPEEAMDIIKKIKENYAFNK